MNTVVKKPILGSMKHANVPPSFSPEPNLNKALDSIEQTLNTFLNSVNAWREKSRLLSAVHPRNNKDRDFFRKAISMILGEVLLLVTGWWL